MNKIELWESPQSSSSARYIIQAGVNRYGRQMYLIGYTDRETAWDISAVPMPMPESKCNKIIKLAEKALSQLPPSKFIKYNDNIQFEMIEYVDKWS